MKAIFLDQDDTLADGAPAGQAPHDLALCSGAGPALRLLARQGYRLFVVGSQSGSAFGRGQERKMDGVGERLRALLERERLTLDGFYHCPHDAGGSAGASAGDCHCHCRRPVPGLLLRAAHEHGIALRASWMIGALLHDVEAGNRAGCRTILLDKGKETEWRLGPRRMPTRIAPDLYTAAVLIVRHAAVAA